MSDVQKLKLGFGDIQIEYEGQLTELKEHLPELLKVIEGFKPALTIVATGKNTETAPAKVANNNKIEATTNTLAAKLNCSSCSELIKAAALQLTLVQGKTKFTRQELVTEMKTSSYYKDTYMGNLNKYLKTLIKAGFLNEAQKDVYAVNPSQLSVLEAQIA